MATLPEEELLLVHGLQPLLLLSPGLEHLLPPALQGLQPFPDLQTGLWGSAQGGGAAVWMGGKWVQRKPLRRGWPGRAGQGTRGSGSG